MGREEKWRYREKRRNTGIYARGDNEKWERKVMEAQRKSEVWEVVNRERRRTRR